MAMTITSKLINIKMYNGYLEESTREALVTACRPLSLQYLLTPATYMYIVSTVHVCKKYVQY